MAGRCDICRSSGPQVQSSSFTLCVRCAGKVKVNKEYLYRKKVYNRSKTQGNAKTALKKLVSPVLEEVYFPWAKNPSTEAMLPYDFYIPGLNLVIEIQGAEHYEFIPIFHGTEQGFIDRQLIDHLKMAFAEDNDYNYLAIDGRQMITKVSMAKELKEWTQHAKFRRSLPTRRKTGRLYGAEMD